VPHPIDAQRVDIQAAILGSGQEKSIKRVAKQKQVE
jgi:hypothetical protein